MAFRIDEITCWMQYGLMRGRPWCGLEYRYENFLESPGTKAYTVDEARQLFGQFSDVRIAIQVNYGDLLQSEVGRRHRGPLLSIAKKLRPRWLIRRLLKRHGLYLLITAVKEAALRGLPPCCRLEIGAQPRRGAPQAGGAAVVARLDQERFGASRESPHDPPAG